MSKKIKTDLSNTGINQMINSLEKLKANLEKADEEIVKQLSDLCLNEIQKNYASTGFKDGNDDVYFFEKGTSKRKIVGVAGTQVLYNEFGTGTEGARSPHPEKNKYGLNPYNSGPKIKVNKSDTSTASQFGIGKGELYWIYDKNGIAVYTQGIPAGKQVYNARKTLQKKKKEITKKVVGDVLSKL